MKRETKRRSNSTSGVRTIGFQMLITGFLWGSIFCWCFEYHV